jgi:hypothetical protein
MSNDNIDNIDKEDADGQIKPIEDLGHSISADDADQVKGGFDPQPDPPSRLDPRQISAKYFQQ